MLVIVIADIDIQKEFESKGLPEGVVINFETTTNELKTSADCYFYLLPEDEFEKDRAALSNLERPVFVNAVVRTLGELPQNAIRINTWPGFLQRSLVEIVAAEQMKESVSSLMEKLGWGFQFVPDLPGMMTARIIAMIINEAYFALGDEVSTKEDIDIAMKLGTNYPYGPFEWVEKIGRKNILDLLTKLAETESLYEPAPALLNETIQ
jgi:3-hydroxybutyryl-CoA dehydrogenase